MRIGWMRRMRLVGWRRVRFRDGRESAVVGGCGCRLSLLTHCLGLRSVTGAEADFMYGLVLLQGHASAADSR